MVYRVFVNPCLNNKILDWSKLKWYSDETLNFCSNAECYPRKDRKYCWKKRKCWFPGFSHFTTMFSKGFFLRVLKTRVCSAKSLGYVFTNHSQKYVTRHGKRDLIETPR